MEDDSSIRKLVSLFRIKRERGVSCVIYILDILQSSFILVQVYTENIYLRIEAYTCVSILVTPTSNIFTDP